MSLVSEASLERLARIARAAGAAIMAHYGDTSVVAWKGDKGPLTRADKAAHETILGQLNEWSPEVPVLSEEGEIPSPESRSPWKRFWLVDPLDGTKEFLKGNGEFTVNIALIDAARPILGVVAAPALSLAYAGAGEGSAREWRHGHDRAIKVRNVPAEGLTVVASRSHGNAEALDRWLAGRKVCDTRQAGSSLKFCLVAAGEADLYPRFGRTMEWDTAAGHAVLTAAGGQVRTLSGEELRYAKPGFENPHFVASS